MAVVTYRSTSAEIFTANKRFDDNIKAAFGDADDAFIRWDGSALDIQLDGGGVAIQDADLPTTIRRTSTTEIKQQLTHVNLTTTFQASALEPTFVSGTKRVARFVFELQGLANANGDLQVRFDLTAGTFVARYVLQMFDNVLGTLIDFSAGNGDGIGDTFILPIGVGEVPSRLLLDVFYSTVSGTDPAMPVEFKVTTASGSPIVLNTSYMVVNDVE